MLSHKLQKVVLTGVETGGILTSLLFAPGAIAALDTFLPDVAKLEDRERELRKTLSYLKYHKLVTIKDLPGGDQQITITGAGKKRVKILQLQTLHIPEPAQWDKQWRLVIFDIPSTYKKSRERFRYWLKYLEFERAQHSVWAHPFPCFEEIELLKAHYKLRDYVTVLCASEIDPDLEKRLRKSFQNRGIIS